MDQVIALLQEVTRQDLERCQAAIRGNKQADALVAIEAAFAKLDTAIDLLRASPPAYGQGMPRPGV